VIFVLSWSDEGDNCAADAIRIPAMVETTALLVIPKVAPLR
jgi:hypothetical protein